MKYYVTVIGLHGTEKDLIVEADSAVEAILVRYPHKSPRVTSWGATTRVENFISTSWDAESYPYIDAEPLSSMLGE